MSRALERGEVHAADRQVEGPGFDVPLDRARRERGGPLLEADRVHRGRRGRRAAPPRPATPTGVAGGSARSRLLGTWIAPGRDAPHRSRPQLVPAPGTLSGVPDPARYSPAMRTLIVAARSAPCRPRRPGSLAPARTKPPASEPGRHHHDRRGRLRVRPDLRVEASAGDTLTIDEHRGRCRTRSP